MDDSTETTSFPALPLARYSDDAVNGAMAVIEEAEAVDDELLERITFLEAFFQRVRECERTFKETMTAKAKQLGQIRLPLADGESLIYLAKESSADKCKSIEATTQALFESGDWGAFVACLSTNAYKPGATRKALAAIGANPDEHFEKVVTAKLDAEGRPQLSLVKLNTRFLR